MFREMNRTFEHIAAKMLQEPLGDLSNFRCVRSQHQLYRVRKKFDVALQRKERSFMHAAAKNRYRVFRWLDRV